MGKQHVFSTANVTLPCFAVVKCRGKRWSRNSDGRESRKTWFSFDFMVSNENFRNGGNRFKNFLEICLYYKLLF